MLCFFSSLMLLVWEWWLWVLFLSLLRSLFLFLSLLLSLFSQGDLDLDLDLELVLRLWWPLGLGGVCSLNLGFSIVLSCLKLADLFLCSLNTFLIKELAGVLLSELLRPGWRGFRKMSPVSKHFIAVSTSLQKVALPASARLPCGSNSSSLTVMLIILCLSSLPSSSILSSRMELNLLLKLLKSPLLLNAGFLRICSQIMFGKPSGRVAPIFLSVNSLILLSTVVSKSLIRLCNVDPIMRLLLFLRCEDVVNVVLIWYD